MKFWSVLLSLIIPLLDAAEEGAKLPSSRYWGLAGKEVVVPHPSAKATVLVFLSTTCPICNKYAPELQRIAADYGTRGVHLLLVQVESDLEEEAARKHAAEFKLGSPVILDPRHRLARSAGAKFTPEAVVLSPQGVTLYRGRIDDRFPSVGKDALTPKSRDLREALDEILAGKPVTQPTTPAVGCHIE